MENNNIKKGLLKNTIEGGIFFILLLVFYLFDKKNSIGFLSRDLSTNRFLGTLIPSLIIGIVIVSIFSYVINVLFLIKPSKNEETNKKVVDASSTFNIVPIVLSIFLCIDAFFFSPVRVSGLSMNDTLSNNDVLLVSRNYKSIEKGDIIIIEKDDDDLIIKRVVAREGDTIKVDNNKNVYVNGELIESSTNWHGGSFVKIEERVLEKGEYYCLGDNRNNSSDSRYYGIFTEKQVIGKVFISLSPLKTKLEEKIVYK